MITKPLNDILAAVGGAIAGDVGAVLNPYGFTQNQRFIFEGDSLTAGTSSTPWPNAFLALPWAIATGASGANVATGGHHLTELEADFSTQVYPQRPALNNNRLTTAVIWIGANDYIDMGNTGGLADLPAWFTRLSAYWTNCKNAGFRVIAVTIMRRADQGGDVHESVRIAANKLILASAIPDIIIDASGLFQNPEDTNLFNVDKVHLKDSGNRLFAKVVQAACVNQIASPAIMPLDYVYALQDSTFRGEVNLSKGLKFGTEARFRSMAGRLEVVTGDAGTFYPLYAQNLYAVNQVQCEIAANKGFTFGNAARLRWDNAYVECVNNDNSGFHPFRAGIIWATVSIKNQGPVNFAGFTVATLPAGTLGDMVYVTDAVAPTYNGALTGGGTVKVPVFHNGTAWVSH